MHIAFPVFFLVMMVVVFYRQFGLVPCLTIPPGLCALAGAWFAFVLPGYEPLLFPLLVVVALCFSAAFAFRRSQRRAREIQWEQRERAREHYLAWRADRNNRRVVDAWETKEHFWAQRDGFLGTKRHRP